MRDATVLYPASPACAEAVRLYCALVAEATVLRPFCTEGAAEDPVTFEGGGGARPLTVRWQRESGGDRAAWEMEADDPSEEAPCDSAACYAATAEALARNEAAAQALLRRHRRKRRGMQREALPPNGNAME